MNTRLTITAAATFLLGLSPAMLANTQEVVVAHEVHNGAVADAQPTNVEESRVVELAICLDTSGSMDGLINAARQKLWSIVNELALAQPTPTLRVALLTYGNDGHNPENGWVAINTPFTEDLDKVSEMLFALTTNGGTELVARVLHSSIEELEWTNSEDALRMVVVAGNESANQDEQFSYKDVCKQAISMGVMVNSIYCVYSGDGPEVADEWKQVAQLADGQYATIDQNNTAVVIASPLDDALIELSAALNETYIPFGTQGQAGWANQQAQDFNALEMNKAAAASRAQTKGGALYACSWDLVDACFQFEQNIEDVPEDQLPENLRAMSMDERKEYVADMKARRESIQKQINELNAERLQYVTAEQKRQAARGVDQFDLIINTAIREQARARGFEIANPAHEPANEVESLPYFVQYGDAWVAADFADRYERLQRSAAGLRADLRIEEGTDDFALLTASLDDKLRAALESIETGTAWLVVDQRIYAVTMNDPEPTGVDVNAAALNSRGQQAQVAQTMQIMPRQQQVGAGSAPVPPVQQAQQDVQQEELPIVLVDSNIFVPHGSMWVDASYIEPYKKLLASNAEPTFDETVPNTPEGRTALLERLSEPQREAAEVIFEHMLEFFDGGMIVRVDGKLVYLPFDC